MCYCTQSVSVASISKSLVSDVNGANTLPVWLAKCAIGKIVAIASSKEVSSSKLSAPLHDI